MNNVVQQHIPVLEQAAIEYLNIQPDGIYIDATLGRGGHSSAILKKLGPHGRLICLDKDSEAQAHAHALFGHDSRVSCHHTCFSQIKSLCEDLNLVGKVNGILFDLGVSSPQLDTPERGFSFRDDGPLDMRMDTTTGESASEWINKASQTDIQDILKRFGDEKYAKRIAGKIIESRDIEPITHTKALARIITEAQPRIDKNKHPATRSFQAIRIHVNQELSVLETALQSALDILAPQGRLCVISFHSLEDRIVKRFMREQSEVKVPAKLPIKDEDIIRNIKVIAKKVRASDEEVEKNPRSRSAVMRIAQKIV